MRLVVLTWTLCTVASPVFAQSFTVSGGLDIRAAAGTIDGANARLEGLFLNLRGVIPQGGADRWILVLQTDSGDNFEAPHLYQTFVQLKGPLGRWNVQSGRYLVPFGLLTSYDTERLVLRSIEPLSLGLKLDEGVQVHGFTDAFDYAASLSDGVRERNPVFIARIGKQWGETAFGASAAVGRLPETASKESVELPGRVLDDVPLVRKFRVALDVTRSAGPRLWRAELVGGTDDGHIAGGGYAEVEQSLSPTWTLAFNAGLWQGAERRWRLGGAASRRLSHRQTVRAGLLRRTEHEERGYEVVLQYYCEFSRHW